jgi:hypothetical protein
VKGQFSWLTLRIRFIRLFLPDFLYIILWMRSPTLEHLIGLLREEQISTIGIE